MIEIKELSKEFIKRGNPIQALSGINLHIKRGEIFTLIGQSGAGKSTLLRSINLLEAPSSGQILIDGQDITALSSQKLNTVRQSIGMIFQHFNLVQNKTVKENILLPLTLRGQAVDKEKFTKLLALVGLSEKINAYPEELSGGQKQRVAIARALISEPKILLCDEATSALDPDTTRAILALLKTINETLHVTIVMITHEMEVVKAIANRFAVMDKGRITSISDIETLLHSGDINNLLFRELITPLPERISGALKSQATNNSYPVYNVIFLGDVTNQAVISEVSQQTEVKVNILRGNISSLRGIAYGVLTLQLIGSDEQIKQAIAIFNAAKLQLECLGYVE